MRYLLIGAALLCSSPDGPPEGGGADWIKSPPLHAFAEATSMTIGDRGYYEVVASKLYVALMRDLETKTFVALSRDDAQYYTGPYFACPDGKTPYLVRAVYGNGGTGRYTLTRDGKKLLVEHGSLGRNNWAIKSALVVNLDFVPEAVYATVKIAK